MIRWSKEVRVVICYVPRYFEFFDDLYFLLVFNDSGKPSFLSFFFLSLSFPQLVFNREVVVPSGPVSALGT